MPSVIIRVINIIGQPRSGSPICLIRSMITDPIGRRKLLLPINHNYYTFRENKCIPFSVKELSIPNFDRQICTHLSRVLYQFGKYDLWSS